MGFTAKDAEILLGGVDISGTANYVEVNLSKGVDTFYVYADKSSHKLPGKFDAKGVLRVVYTEAGGEGWKVIKTAFDNDASTLLQVSPRGGNVGEDRFSGYIHFDKLPLKFDGEKADTLIVQATFEVDGDVTIAAIT